MKLTIVQIINLITHLYMPLPGYWIEELKYYPEAQIFLKAGYLSLEENYKDKYVINSKGKVFLHPYIEKISIDFIKFMKSNQMLCSKAKIVQYYMETYLLDDSDTAEVIAEYICKNLQKYGYFASQFYSSQKGEGYSIEKNVY